MNKKEQTNGGSNNISCVGGNMYVDSEKKLDIPPKSMLRYGIATLERLEKTGYLEINVGHHEAFKEGEKIVKRIVEGKEIKGNRKKRETKKSKDLESR